MSDFILGMIPPITATFKVDGVATDPSSLTLTVQGPDGVEESFVHPASEIDNPSAGVYISLFTPDLVGTWVYRFVGTGVAAGAQEFQFEVVSDVEDDALRILTKPSDYDDIRALLGVTDVDLKDHTIDLPSYAPYIEARVKAIVTDWAVIAVDPDLAPFLRAAVRYGTAATLAESYMKGGTVSLVHKEEPRRNWSEWARIFWMRYKEALARVTSEGVADDQYNLSGMKLAHVASRRYDERLVVYPPEWPE